VKFLKPRHGVVESVEELSTYVHLYKSGNMAHGEEYKNRTDRQTDRQTDRDNRDNSQKGKDTIAITVAYC